MLTRNERRRYEALGRVPIPPAAVALKCAVCIGVIAVIGWIGVHTPLREEGRPTLVTGLSVPQERVSTTVQHSREIRDQRRARFQPQPDALAQRIAP